MGDSRDLRRLIDAARAGDPGAWEKLVGEYSASLEHFIEAKLGEKLRRRVSPEDLLQEALLNAYSALDRFEWRGPDRFVAWLRAIAENVVREAGRRQGAEKRAVEKEVLLPDPPDSSASHRVDLENLVPASGPSPSQGAQRKERLDRVTAALESLRQEDREVILRISVERQPVKEVAEVMGRTPAATSMLLLRALRKFRAVYGEIDSTDSLRLPDGIQLGGDGKGEGRTADDDGEDTDNDPVEPGSP